MGTRHLQDLCRHRGRHLTADLGAVVGGNLGPAMIRGQVQHIRQTRQLFTPVGQLASHHRARIAGTAERPVLPDGVVGELHGQRSEFRCAPVDPGGICGKQITHQRQHGFAVDADMMADDGQQMP